MPNSSCDESIEIVNQLNTTSLDPCFLWGRHGTRGNALRLTEQGRCRFGQCVGFLQGLLTCGHASAEAMCSDFVRQMDYLANYGRGEADEPSPYLVQLGDDGTFGGFTVCWLRLREPHTVVDANASLLRESRYYNGEWSNREWVFCMNGGLLFHGFDHSNGGAPTFAVRVGDTTDRFWSLHT